jgi:GGDEF domain-containing protein
LCGRLEKAVIGFKLPVGEGEFARVGVSLGAASYPLAGETFDQLVIAADKAMYAVKAIRKRKQMERAKQIEPTIVPTANVRIIQNQIMPVKTQVQEIREPHYAAHRADDGFIVELDESHIVSSAVN